MSGATAPRATRRSRWWVEIGAVVGAWGLVYLPLLGRHPFRSTEGHRVVPAWELLERGELLPLTLFERVYARKPPGMSWAIAASSGALGETEFAARLVSAVAMAVFAVASWWFASRWFGRPWGVAAGLAAVFTPAMWLPGRSAEIESMVFASTAVAALSLVELLRSGGNAWVGRAGLGVGLFASLLAKGPAGLTVLIAAAGVGWWVLRPARSRWAPVAMATIVAVSGFLLVMARMGMGDEGAATQGVDSFVFRPENAVDLAAMPLVAWATLLPASLAVLLPWGPDARREGEASPEAGERRRLGLVLAGAAAGAVMINLVLGLSNPRYALPAVATMPALAAYAARGAFGGDFVAHRRAIARAMCLGHPASWPAAALIGAAVWIGAAEPRRAETSADDAAEALAPLIVRGAEVWASSQINTRPELLLYIERRSNARAIWRPGAIARAVEPERGEYLLLTVAEMELYAAAIEAGRVVEIGRAIAREREVVLLRGEVGGTMPTP